MNTWVDYIRGDLQAHIAAGGPLPAPLTLHGLSGHYAVSMTPIRRAVRELIADGLSLPPGERPADASIPAAWAMRRRSRRPPRRRPATIPARSAAALAELSLAGRTVFVREEETAERVAVSTTAVRHVFHELAGAGCWSTFPAAAAPAPFPPQGAGRLRPRPRTPGVGGPGGGLAAPRRRTLGGDLPGQRASRRRGRAAADRRLAARLPDREGGQRLHPRFLSPSQPILRDPVSLGEHGPPGGDLCGPAASGDPRCALAPTGLRPRGAFRPTSATAIPCCTSDSRWRRPRALRSRSWALGLGVWGLRENRSPSKT